MQKALRALLCILPIPLVWACEANHKLTGRQASRGTPITITCVPEWGLKYVYQGSIIGPEGRLADGDEYVPYVVLRDGKRKFELSNHTYRVYIENSGLDPKKEYTFVIERTANGETYRILRILDGTEVKFDIAARKGNGNK